MRVLFLAHSFPRFVGDNPGSFVLRLAQALTALDIHVTAVVPSGPGLAPRDVVGGVPVERFRYAPRSLETLAYTGTMAEQVRGGVGGKAALAGLLAAGATAAVQAARAMRADLVHAHWWVPGGVAGTAARALVGTPLVTTVHGSDIRLVRTVPGGATLLRSVVRHSARVTAVSRWLADELRRAVPGVDPVVAPMPVDVAMFTPALTSGGSRARLLFVGRLNEQKGLDVLLRALAASRVTMPLDVVGDGPLADTLHRLAASLGVADQVTWHGLQPAQRLAEFYRQACALVVPSIDEGLGLVAVEAQLSGTPVIAFASGGLVDVVRHERTGLLVPPGDVAALGAAVLHVTAEPGWAAELGRAGRTHALARFAPAAVAEEYAQIYREAVGGRRA